MPSILRLILVPVALVGTAVRTGAEGKGNGTDAKARAAVEQFFKAFKAKDLEGLVKTADVPFCREGGKNIEKRDDLEKFFRKALRARDPSNDTIVIKLVTTLPKLEESDGKFTDDERKVVEEVLGKDHRVVKVEWNRFGEGVHKTLIFVRLLDGKAKVAGII